MLSDVAVATCVSAMKREQRPRLVPHEGHKTGCEHAAGDAAELAEGAHLLLEQPI